MASSGVSVCSVQSNSGRTATGRIGGNEAKGRESLQKEGGAQRADDGALERSSGGGDRLRAVLGHAILGRGKDRSSHETVPSSDSKRDDGKSHISGDDDDASEKSQRSAATQSSVFTKTCIKLKAYLPSTMRSYKQKAKDNTNNDRNKERFSLSEGDLLGGISAAKGSNNRYKRSSQRAVGSSDRKHKTKDNGQSDAKFSLSEGDLLGSSTTTADTSGFCSTRGSSTGDEGSKPPVRSSLQILEEEQVYPIVDDAAVKVATNNGPEERTSYAKSSPAGGATHVLHLPWVDNSTGGTRMHGLYSGSVNDLLQPHGEGTLVLEGNSFLKFYGNWVNGNLCSPLRNEDEQRYRETHGHDNVNGNFCSSLRNEDEQRYQDTHGYDDAEGVSCDMHRNPSHDNIGGMRYGGKDRKKEPSGEYNDGSANQCNNERSTPKTYKKKSSRDPSGAPPTSSSKTTTSEEIKQSRSHRRRPPKHKYALGEVARSPGDMIIHRSGEKGIQCVSSIRKYDQAFLKRSNGLWTCAVLADRALQPTNSAGSHWYPKSEIDDETMELEESMLFVINEDGATKIVKMRHWGRFVRCMQKDAGGTIKRRGSA